uniref:Serine protease inhibitor n=2 Tax=Cotesia chilonis TaxID=89804 RepID=A0A1J0M5I0_9HYME|nr:serine protease inhibitor [Cotesia chilonis]
MIKLILIATIVVLTIPDSSCYSKCIASKSIKYPQRFVFTMTDLFLSDIYKVLARYEKGNIIFSPLSLNAILTMVSLGARGNTSSELSTSLRLSCDKNIAGEGYRQLIHFLLKIEGVKLKFANKIFVPQTSVLKNSFRSKMKWFFNSDTSIIDPTRPEKAAEDINRWYAKETENHITNLYEPSDIENAKILLANAVYFKGNWANKFNPRWTQPYPFYVNGNRKSIKDVPMMFLDAEFYWGYIQDLKSGFIELPYDSQTNPAMKMTIILPNLGVDIRDVERNISKLPRIQYRGATSKIALHLPKFKIESKFDLKPILKKIGINNMFENTADFQNMTENSGLKVTKVVQKVVIEVNEEGSEAVVASGMTMESREASPVFTVNRPFLCVISMERMKWILFFARVMDPTAV